MAANEATILLPGAGVLDRHEEYVRVDGNGGPE
jgi:hypothetical protein